MDEASRGLGGVSTGLVHQDKLHDDDSRVVGEGSSEDKIDVKLRKSGTAADVGGPINDDEAYYDDGSNDETRETVNGQALWNGSHSDGSGGQGTANEHKLSVGDNSVSGSDVQASGTIDQFSVPGDQSSGTSGHSSATIDRSSAIGDQSSKTSDQSSGTGDQSHVNNGHALINAGGSLGNDGQAPVGIGQGYIHQGDVPDHDDQRTVVHSVTAFHPVADQKLKSQNIASSHDGRSDNLIVPARSRHHGDLADGQPGVEPHLRGPVELQDDTNSGEEDSAELSEDAESQEVSVVSMVERSREKMLSTIVGAVVLAFFFMLAGMLFALVLSRIE